MEAIKKYTSDIRFWIILFFIIRLYGITQAPLEAAHNWRQTTVTMVARNYYEGNTSLLYPQIDFAGEKTGITGMEFPILNYLIYLVSLIFGYEHWYGRLINLIISSVGIYYFYRLLLKFTNKELSFTSCLILISSIWFAYSRKIMPDTFSTSLVIIGFYYLKCYLDGCKKWRYLILYSLFLLLGILAKLPNGYLLALLVFPLVDTNISKQIKWYIISATFIILAPIVIYYFYWVPYLVAHYGFWHFFMGKTFVEGIKEITSNLGESTKHFYDHALKFIGFACFLIGLIFSVKQKNRKLLLFFATVFFSFCVVIFKAGFTFTHHAYYIIPFVPFMAIFAAYGLQQIPNYTIRIIILIAIVVEGILNQQHDFRISKDNLAIQNLENDLNQFSKKSDLLIINSNDYPTPIYFAHRKGWITTNDKLENEHYIDSLKGLGLKQIVVLKKTFGSEVKLKYQQVFSDENYTIYKLD